MYLYLVYNLIISLYISNSCIIGKTKPNIKNQNYILKPLFRSDLKNMNLINNRNIYINVNKNLNGQRVLFTPTGSSSFFTSTSSISNDDSNTNGGYSDFTTGSGSGASDVFASGASDVFASGGNGFSASGDGGGIGVVSNIINDKNSYDFGALSGMQSAAYIQGAYYKVTDKNGITVYYMGTLCLDSGGMCDIILQPGCYLFRVDGKFDPNINDISWQFCGAKGGAQTQLTFCIDNNYRCNGMKIDTAEDICNNIIADFTDTVLSYKGTIHLDYDNKNNITYLSNNDISAIRNTLIKEFSDASDSPDTKGVVEINKLSWKSEPSLISNTDSHDRKLYNNNVNNLYTVSISFEVKLLGERYGIKNTLGNTNNQDEISLLHHHMNEYLSKSISEGIFIGRLKVTAKLMNAKNIESINFIKLGEVHMIQNKVYTNETSIFTIIIVVCSMIIGIVSSYSTHCSMSNNEILYNDNDDNIVKM